MTSQPFPDHEEPPACPDMVPDGDPDDLERLPCDPDAERDLVGAVLYDESAFDLAGVKSSDFYIHRYCWMWEAYEAILAAHDHIDVYMLEKELVKAWRLEEVRAQHSLDYYLYPTTFHAEADGRRVRAWVERRRMLLDATELAQRAWDPKYPIPDRPFRPRILRRTAAYALQARPPLEWVVEPIISRGSVNLFYGEPGAKKTYSLLSMGVCVASGRPWLDMQTKTCKVLFIDEESGEGRLSLRLASALRGELAWEETPFEFISLAGFHLDDPADVVLLEKEITESGVGLVIFDSLADLMEGDENSKQDTQPVFRALRRLAEHTGAALCIIHHANKLGGYRGSSAIKGAVDLMVHVTSEDGSEFVNFKSEKNRDGEAVGWAARCSWVKEPETFSLLAAATHEKAKTLSKSQDFVIRYLKEHGANPLPVIMAAADVCSPGTARNAVYSLVPQGLVVRINPQASAYEPAIYKLKACDTTEGVS